MHREVVLLDVQLPDVDGFEVASRLAVRDDAPAVILTSSRDGDEFGGMIADSGARGFLTKGELSAPALPALLR
jgi:DNA-binding response OmpR family regulator